MSAPTEDDSWFVNARLQTASVQPTPKRMPPVTVCAQPRLVLYEAGGESASASVPSG